MPASGLMPKIASRWVVLGGIFSLSVLFLLLRPVGPVNSASPRQAANSASQVAAFYSAASFWNTPIAPHAAIDRNSAGMVSYALSACASNAVLANDDAWGMGYVYAGPESKLYTIACTTYCAGDTIVFPIPDGALPSTGSDHHLAVIKGSQELDMWEASYDRKADRWSAGSRTVTSITGWGANCGEREHCGGAVAAGFAMLGGSIRPEEIAQGHIDHALALNTPATKSGYIACPATNTDGASDNPDAIPQGARVQLDPAFDVDGQAWPAWEKTVAKALQTYGAYVVDTSGVLALYAVSDVNPGNISWSSVGMSKAPSLANLPWSRFRVLQIRSCN